MFHMKKGDLSCNTHYKLQHERKSVTTETWYSYGNFAPTPCHEIISNCNVKFLESPFFFRCYMLGTFSVKTLNIRQTLLF